jgi:hypothetical protein
LSRAPDWLSSAPAGLLLGRSIDELPTGDGECLFQDREALLAALPLLDKMFDAPTSEPRTLS